MNTTAEDHEPPHGFQGEVARPRLRWGTGSAADDVSPHAVTAASVAQLD